MSREILSPGARASISYIEALTSGRRNRDLLRVAKTDKINVFTAKRRLLAALKLYREEPVKK